MINVADVAIARSVQFCETAVSKPALPWFAVRMREKLWLATEMMFQAQNIEYFAPATTEIHLWSDRRKTVLVPLFPGYVFCRFDPEQASAILRVFGVIDIVRAGSRLSAVDPTEIAAIQRAVETKQPISAVPLLQSGQRVQVLEGPLRGLEGVLREYKSQTRLVLAVTMMNRAVSIEIDRNQVSPAA